MNKFRKLLCLILVVVMVLPTVLASCGNNQGDSGGNDGGTSGGNTDNGGGTGNNNGSGSQGGDSGNQGGGDENTPTTEYTVTLTTAGGMKLENTTFFVYGYKNGAIDRSDFVTFGSTDEDGAAKVSLADGKQYCVDISSTLPKGYNVEQYYPIVGTKLDITVSSSVITGEKIDGKSLSVGDIMYDFEYTTTDGTKFKLSEALKTHKAVVINFWYDGCSWCEVEFPIMETVYRNQGGDAEGNGTYDESIALIALSDRDSLSAIQNYKNNFDLDGLDITMATDGGAVTQAFGVVGWPTTVVIDRYGMVALKEEGALTTERPFRILFDHFRSDNYVQQKISSLEEITPIEKPSDFGVVMPDSDDFAAAFEEDDANLNITYSNDPEDEVSWPFIIDEFGGETVVRPSNDYREASYAQLFATVTLNAGDVVAFDYFSSTEFGADRLYVLIDKKDIYSISGESSFDKDSGAPIWKTCFCYVAEETGTYEIALCYIKDDSADVGDDTVYLKNLRIVTENDIDLPTYIYRFAAYNRQANGTFGGYVDIYLNENDGYYHVGSENGPILLADLMGYAQFGGGGTSFYELIIGKAYEAEAIKYCGYASNSKFAGLCSVNEELMEILKTVADANGGFSEDSWLEFCCYYDSYGTNEDGNPVGELEDPIKGLAAFSAYDVILSESGATDYPNKIVYDRVIMPRGLLYRFTPEVSGVYSIISNTLVQGMEAPLEVNAWIFKNENLANRTEWLVYDNVARHNFDTYNCYMIAYLEKGVDYYIDIAYYDVYQYGTVEFRVERLGDEGFYRFTLASPGHFTYTENTSGSVNRIEAGGIDVVFKNHAAVGEKPTGYWYVNRNDDKASLLYADFTINTSIFNRPIYSADEGVVDMIDAGAFNFLYDENDQYVLNYLDKNVQIRNALTYVWGNSYKENVTKYGLEKVLKGDYSHLSDTDAEYMQDLVRTALFRALWGEDYEVLSELFNLDDALNGSFAAVGPDATDAMVAIALSKADGDVAAAKAALKKDLGEDYTAELEAIVDDVANGVYHSANNEYLKDLMSKAIFKLIWADEYETYAEIYKVDEVLAGKYHGAAPSEKDLEIMYYKMLSDGDTARTEAYLRNLWGDNFEAKAEEYKLSEVFNGKYHGEGVDYSEAVRAYVEANIIKEGEHSLLGTIEAGDERIGCVVVDAELSIWLQLLMDKYTFGGVDHSWTKLCYYTQYFSADTPK